MGFIFAIIAGITMTLQGVFNTRTSQKIGLWETNLLVQGTAFICTLIVFFFLRKGDYTKISGVNKLYLFGGLIGVIITYSVMKGMSDLGPTVAILLILISQLISAAIIDAFGIFDSNKIPFHWNNYVGIALMIIGIILFKFKK